MKWLKKLNNPFLLGLNGFAVGAFLFLATHPGTFDSDSGAGNAQLEHSVRTGA